MRATVLLNRRVRFWLALFLVISGRMTWATGAPADTGAEDLRPARWWLHQAAAYSEKIPDAPARSDAFYKLAYVAGHADDLALASEAAAKVSKPLKAIYALTFVAKRFQEQGKSSDTAKMLEQARQVAQRHAQKLTNFGHSHLVRAYVERGLAADARAYVDSIADPVQRDLASRELLAAMAKNELLDIETMRLTEPEWSEVACALASEGRVKETLNAAERLGTDKSRDRAYSALVKTLVERKRWPEAERVPERIASPEAKAQAKASILAEWASEQTSEQIAARLEQVGTREEKEALYNKFIEKLAAEGRLDQAENAIKAMVDVIKDSPRPALVSAFGIFDDAHAIAAAKANYLFVAKALAKRGDRAAAQQRIEWAAEPILALDRSAGLGKMMLVARLVEAQITIGDLAGARNTLVNLKGPFRDLPAARLAEAHAKAGDAAAAIEAAQLIPEDDNGRGNLYGSVAVELIRAGNEDAARQLLAELGTSAEHGEAYLAGAAAMIESGDTDGLRKWLTEMSSPVHQAFACMGAAEALREAGTP